MLPAVILGNWRLIAAGAVLAGAFGAGWSVNGNRMHRQIAELKAEHLALVASAERVRADEENAQRAIEADRETARQEIDHASSLARARADADRRSADAAQQRLLDTARAAAAAGTACKDSIPSGEREAASRPVSGLVDVLGDASQEAGRLAAALDQSRAAGLACERYVDALTKEKAPHF